MNAIVAVDRNWGIGKGNGLLVHLPGDLKYFKEKTKDKIIVIGRKTLESFPGGKPLPNRVNIVLSTNPNYDRDDCIVCHSKEEVLEKLSEYETDKICICGGGVIYRLFLEDCDYIYVTKIDEVFDAEVFFPNLDEMGYEADWESDLQCDNGVEYRFLRYRKPR